MKTILFIVLALTPAMGVSQKSRDVRIDYYLVANSELIALVKIQDVSDKMYLQLIRLFKGACVSDNEIVLSHYGFTENFSHHTEYLLFAKVDDNCHYYFDNESKLIGKEGEQDVDFLLKNLPCIDPRVKERYSGAPCHRNLSPVCACDGIEYNNVCEARNAGVQILKKGRCDR